MHLKILLLIVLSTIVMRVVAEPASAVICEAKPGVSTLSTTDGQTIGTCSQGQ
jgi:hypothetical protein